VKGSTLIKALLIIIACVLVIYAPITYLRFRVSQSNQALTLHIRVVSEDGGSVPYARILVFMLTDKGPSLIGGAGTFANGAATAHVLIPRRVEYYVWRLEPYLRGGKIIYRFVRTNEPGYASVNLALIATSPNGMMGAKVLSVDPSFLKWPEDKTCVTVKLRRPPKGNGVVHEELTSNRVVSWWQHTPVLRFGAGDAVRIWYNFSVGSKVEVQSKYRVCGLGTCTSWESAGSTQVTVEVGIRGGNVTGHVVRTVYFDLRYVDWTYCDAITKTCVNIIYVADTRIDPHAMTYRDSPWRGKLPDTPYYLMIPHDSTVRIIVNGGYHWDLNVRVNTSANGGPNTYVTLGVTLSGKANPPVFLYVQAGHGEEGRQDVKIVSLHGSGGKGSYVVTYGDWT